MRLGAVRVSAEHADHQEPSEPDPDFFAWSRPRVSALLQLYNDLRTGHRYIAHAGIRPGETIIAEHSLTFFPELDASDGMAILTQVVKQRGTAQLLQNVVGMAPLEADVSDKLECEARSELQARGLESTPQVIIGIRC